MKLNIYHHYYSSYYHYALVLALVFLPPFIYPYIQCPLEKGGGICPDGAQCCKMLQQQRTRKRRLGGDDQGHDHDHGASVHSYEYSYEYTYEYTSGCIPSNKHIEGVGTCCHDDITDTNDDNDQYGYDKDNDYDYDKEYSQESTLLGTACAGEYQCDSSSIISGSGSLNDHGDDGITKLKPKRRFFCSLVTRDANRHDYDHDIHNNTTTTMEMEMPRYELVRTNIDQMTLFGFPLLNYANNTSSSMSSSKRGYNRRDSKQQGQQQKQQKQQKQIMTQSFPVIAYNSNFGPNILHANSTIDEQIKAVIIVIHGSGRNSDQYLYSTMALSQMQQKYNHNNNNKSSSSSSSSSSVLILAPKFIVDEDDINSIPVPTFNSSTDTTTTTTNSNNTFEMLQPLIWNEKGPIPHTWRYGANALPPWSNISSYDVVDTLVEHFALHAGSGNRYVNLERIAVIGHSAGGQFVQRWALTSNSLAWGDDYQFHHDTDDDGIYPVITTTTSAYQTSDARRRKLRRLHKLHDPRDLIASSSSFDQQQQQLIKQQQQERQFNLPSIRVVVANPRSFCYLDNRRYINRTYQIPPLPMIQDCPTYNTWEWGLDDGGRLESPYRDRAIDYFNGDTMKLAQRYAERDVVYLAGKNDTEILHSSCEDDDFQGRFRRERSEHFFHSLKDIFGHDVHSRVIVDGVGHDSSLMFESQEGIRAVFD